MAISNLINLRNQAGIVLASKAMPLAMVFLYGHLMPVEHYGLLSLYLSYLGIFGVLMSLNLHTAIGRYLYTDSGDTREFLGSTLVVVSGLYLLFVAAGIVFLADLEGALSLPWTVIGVGALAVYSLLLESILTQVSIAEQRTTSLLGVLATKAVATIALSLGFMLQLERDKYLGVLYAELVCCGAFIGYFAFWAARRARFAFAGRHLKFMLAYSLPLLVYNLSLTLLAQFDRVQIDQAFGKDATGLYSLASNFGMLLNIAATMMVTALTVAFFRGMNAGDHAGTIRDSRALTGVISLLALGIVLFGEPATALIAPPAYDEALRLIPAIAAGAYCLSLFQVWSRVLYFVNLTYVVSLIALAGAVVKLGLNVAFLEQAGYPFAALTTLLGYGAMMLLSAVAAAAYLDGHIGWGKNAAYVVVVIGAAFLPVGAVPPLADFAARALLVAAFAWLARADLARFVALARGVQESAFSADASRRPG